MQRSLQATGHLDAFDFFMLSDATKAEIGTEEEASTASCASGSLRNTPVLPPARQNVGPKAGNIAEWIDTHGRDYAHMIVLDADSLSRRDHGAARRPDGAQSAHRPRPDPHRAGRPRDLFARALQSRRA